jgi:hypothetical protein
VTSAGVTLVEPMARWKNRSRGRCSATGDLDRGLVDLPSVADAMAAGPGGLGEQRREPQHPAVDGGVVDLDAAFGE